VNLVLVDNSFTTQSPFLLNKYKHLSEEHNVSIVHWGIESDKVNTYKFKLLGYPKNKVRILWSIFLTFLFFPKSFLLFLTKGYKILGKNIFKRIFSDFNFIRTKPNIIHFEFGTLAIDRTYLSKIFNCKLIVSFRGYDLNYYKLSNADLYNDVWNNATGFHFLGEDLFKRAQKRGYKTEKLNFFISPAIDTDLFNCTIDRDSNPDTIFIVSVGRVVWKKGYEFGLLAIKQLVKSGFNVHYTIIGGGDNLQAIEFAIHELGLINYVTLTGSIPQKQIIKILERSHIFLHPAVSEGFCNAVVEAQSMKLPVVCTNADGLNENIEEGVTGFAVNIYDSQSLYEKLKDLILNPSLRIEMGNNGRVRAIKLYKLEDQIAKLNNMYNSCLQLKSA